MSDRKSRKKTRTILNTELVSTRRGGFALPEPIMHAKIQDHGTCGSEGEDCKGFFVYGHSGHLCHVYKTIFYKSISPVTKMASHTI